MDKHASVQMDSEEFLKGPATVSFSPLSGAEALLRTGRNEPSDHTYRNTPLKRNSVTVEDDANHHAQNGAAIFTPLSPFPVSDGYALNPFSSSSFSTRTLSTVNCPSPAAQLHSLEGNGRGLDNSRRLANGSLEDNLVDQICPQSPLSVKAIRSASSTLAVGVAANEPTSLSGEGVAGGVQEDAATRQDETLAATMGLVHSSSFSSLSSSSSSSFSSTELESTSLPFLFSPTHLAVSDVTDGSESDAMEEGRRKSALSVVSSPLASGRTAVLPGSFHTLEETIGVVMTSPGRRSSVHLPHQHQHQHSHALYHFNHHRLAQVPANVSDHSESTETSDSLLLNEDSDEEKSESPKRKSRRLSQSHARTGSISGEIPGTATASMGVTSSADVSGGASEELAMGMGVGMAMGAEGGDDSDSDYVPNGEVEELAADEVEEEEDEEEDEEEMRHDQFGVLSWIVSQRERGKSPASTLSSLLSFFPPDLGKREAKNVLWNAAMSVGIHLSKALAKHERRRKKLLAINSLDDAVALIRHSSRIVVLTGAGVSVSAGIPDFRSKGGIYVRLKEEFGCESPEDMFDLGVFKENPKMFYSFAHEVYPAAYQPTLTHKFVALLEEKGKLLRNYTQNIDNLEEKASINKVLQCHGSFATASCITCKHKVKGTEIEKQIMVKEIALCPKCHAPEALQERANGMSASSADVSYGVMKPDIIFFSEPLPSTFHHALEEDRGVADLVIVIGSSLKVHPVAGMLATFPSTVPMILINREVVGFPDRFDIELLGDCDIICAELSKRLNWRVAHDHFSRYAQQDIAFKFFSPNRYVFPRATESLEEVQTQIVDSSFYSSLYRPAMTHPEKDFFSELNRERKRKRMESERKKSRALQHNPAAERAAMVEDALEEEGQTGAALRMDANEHVDEHSNAEPLEGNDKERPLHSDESSTSEALSSGPVHGEVSHAEAASSHFNSALVAPHSH